ncbi:MAG: hypothetical protein LBP54_05430 [Campylobacteraceae bacterium]|nr:hypothetical protein [Campylobacteraceae bacterium]
MTEKLVSASQGSFCNDGRNTIKSNIDKWEVLLRKERMRWIGTNFTT